MLRKPYNLSRQHPSLVLSGAHNTQTLSLNLSHKCNLFTPRLTHSLIASLQSLQKDPLVNSLLITAEAPLFSYGIDYKTLVHSPQLLLQYQQLSQELAMFSKPILVQPQGISYNGANALLYNTPFAQPQKIIHNESEKGFGLLMGVSYQLAKSVKGRYLALTSEPEKFKQNSEWLQNWRENSWKWQGGDWVEQTTFQQDQALVQERLKFEVQDRLENGESARLAMSEVLYKKQQLEESPQSTRRVLGSWELFERDVLGEEWQWNVIKEVQEIDRIFNADSLEEIYSRLAEEKSEWSEKIFQKMKSRCQLTLEIIFEQLKRAETLSFKDCLEMEHVVALNRLKDSYFVNQEKVTDPSRDQVLSYFEPRQHELHYDSKLPEKALYPLKDFYKEIPDQVMFYLNKRSIDDYDARGGQEERVKEFLKSRGLDHRNAALDVDVLRNSVFQEIQNKKRLEYMIHKLKAICSDYKNIEYQQNNYSNYINERFQSDIKPQVDQNITKIFDKFMNQRLEKVKELSKHANLSKKKQFFSKIRDIILRSRMMKVSSPVAEKDYLQEKQEEIMLRNSLRPLFFPESNADNMEETQNNPLLQKVGLQNLIEQLRTLKKDNQLNPENIQTAIESTISEKSLDESQLYEPFLESANKNIERIEHKYGANKQERDFQSSVQDSLEVFQKKVLGMKNITKDVTLQSRLSSTQQWTKEMLELVSNSPLPESIDESALNKLKQELDKIQSFYDLTISPKQEEQLGQSSADLRHFQNFLYQNPSLSQKLDFLFHKQDNACVESLRGRFHALFLNVYHQKMKEINYMNLTVDGYSYHQPAALPVIDHYLSKQSNFYILQNVTPSLLFTFSYLALLEIEELYQTFTQASKLLPNKMEAGSDLAGYKSFLKNHQIEVSQSKDVNTGMFYLNHVVDALGYVFYNYKDQVDSDYEKLFAFYVDLQRVSSLSRDKKTLVQHVLHKYEEKFVAEKEAQRLQRLSPPEYLQESLAVKQEEEDEENDFVYQDYYKEGLKKKFVPGIRNLMVEMDRYVNRGIFGEENSKSIDNVEQEYKDVLEQVQWVDMRWSSQEWFDRKLNVYLESLFVLRFQQEKKLSNSGLFALDAEIQKLLEPETLKNTMLSLLQEDLSQLKVMGEMLDQQKMSQDSEEIQDLKIREEILPEHLGKNVQNEDALNKYIAFNMVQEMKKKNFEHQSMEEIEENYNTQTRLYEEIFKPKFIAESDIQGLYRQVLDKDVKMEEENNYLIWRQNMKSEIKTALQHELNSQVHSKDAKDKELTRLIQTYLKSQ